MDGLDPGSGAAREADRPPLAERAARWPLRVLAALIVVPFVAALLASLALVLALGTARAPAEARGPDEILVLSAASDGALLVALFLIAAASGVRPAELGFRRPTRAALSDALGLTVLLWIASIGVNAASVRVFGPHPQSLVVSLGAHSGPVAYALDMLSSAGVAPLAEETLFRGVIFGGLAQRVPGWAAALLSAFVFAAFHGLGVLLPIFVLGLGLAYVYARTGTIWASMLAHGLVNAVSVTALFVLGGR